MTSSSSSPSPLHAVATKGGDVDDVLLTRMCIEKHELTMLESSSVDSNGKPRELVQPIHDVPSTTIWGGRLPSTYVWLDSQLDPWMVKCLLGTLQANDPDASIHRLILFFILENSTLLELGRSHGPDLRNTVVILR